uniref:Uncharacterized protein n=1 Tax=Arundo donax TaxID=35708 RepID=A0A0A9FIJ8_ARUDO
MYNHETDNLYIRWTSNSNNARLKDNSNSYITMLKYSVPTNAWRTTNGSKRH